MKTRDSNSNPKITLMNSIKHIPHSIQIDDRKYTIQEDISCPTIDILEAPKFMPSNSDLHGSRSRTLSNQDSANFFLRKSTASPSFASPILGVFLLLCSLFWINKSLSSLSHFCYPTIGPFAVQHLDIRNHPLVLIYDLLDPILWIYFLITLIQHFGSDF